ncbi:MAG TPA: anti-sigma factor [Gaiellaceae bacterium]|nr:anti-sigma factor [Gaiellaceae bacterium]
MSGPDFDELVGGEVGGAERERLRRTHELLLTAGPPAEISPEIERGPTLAMTLTGRPRGEFRRRATLLLAAAVAVLAVFLGGYVAGNHGGGTASITVVRSLQLTGNAFAPNATAVLEVQPADFAGNSPMTLVANGLPQPPTHGYYTLWLVRDGKPWGPCGEFVATAGDRSVSVSLTAPYQLEQGDSWVVTLWTPGTQGIGRTVMTASNA